VCHDLEAVGIEPVMSNLFALLVFLRITFSLTCAYYKVPYNTAFYAGRPFYILVLSRALVKLEVIYQCFLLEVACF